MRRLITHIENEVEYIKNVDTAKGFYQAEFLKAKLYKKYHNVKVYPHGLDSVRIVASKPIFQ